MSRCAASDVGTGRLAGLVVRLRALRAFSFPLSALPVLVAAAAPASTWDWGILAASVLGVVLLHAAGNLLNDYFDFRAGVDRRTEGDEGRPGRLLVRGEMTAAAVLGEALLCLALAAPLAAYLVWRRGPGLLWFGAGAVAALYAYTGPPFQLKYRGLGELVIFLIFGPILMTGAGYALAGRFDGGVLLLSIPVGMATTAVVLGNNVRDLGEDGQAGIRTLARALGPARAKALYAALIVGAPLLAAGLALSGLARWGACAGLVSLVGSALLLRRCLTAPRLPDIDARTAKWATVFFVTLGVGLSVG